ncbi:MAG: hypothetical protein HOV97_19165, partial [Nonomuraea sp.]|nr:hypothetical protein [Nonomuraea sp.]
VDTETLRPLRGPERRPFRVDLRMVAAAVVVVLAGASAVVWLGGRGAEQSAALTGPASVQPGLGEVQVFLCARSVGDDPACKGQDATPDQVKSIEAAARRVPGVTSVAYVDRDEAYANFRSDLADNKAVLGAVTADDLHASFRLLIGIEGDPQAASQELRRLPGVADVGVVSGGASGPVPNLGEISQINVFLCQPSSVTPACASGRQKGVTKAQKGKIVALLRAAPEVESVVFQDRETAYKSFTESFRDNKSLVAATRVEDLPESYRVRMRPGADRTALVGALSRQRGVSSVIDGRCLAEVALLKHRYLITLPDGKVCPVGE